MKNTPLISIVTVCRNADATIERTLASIEGQKHDGHHKVAYEHVIIDGGSNDWTLRIVEKYVERQEVNGISVTVISEPDQGIYDAMNKGLALAKGEYIAFLNADDWYDGLALSRVSVLVNSYLNEADSVRNDIKNRPVKDSRFTAQLPDCIGGACAIVDGLQISRIRYPLPAMVTTGYAQEMPAAHQSLFVRTDFMRELGGFRTQFNIAADYDLCLRILAHRKGKSSMPNETPDVRLSSQDTQEEPTAVLDSPTLSVVSELSYTPNWVFTDDVLSYFSLGGTSYHPARTARDYRAVRLDNGWSNTRTDLLYVRNLCASYLSRLTTVTSHATIQQ